MTHSLSRVESPFRWRLACELGEAGSVGHACGTSHGGTGQAALHDSVRKKFGFILFILNLIHKPVNPRIDFNENDRWNIFRMESVLWVVTMDCLWVEGLFQFSKTFLKWASALVSRNPLLLFDRTPIRFHYTDRNCTCMPREQRGMEQSIVSQERRNCFRSMISL